MELCVRGDGEKWISSYLNQADYEHHPRGESVYQYQ
jgi:hypothetical protein